MSSSSAGHPRTGAALIRRSVLRQRGRLVPGGLLLVLWQSCESLVPVLIGITVDQAVLTRDLRALLLCLGAFVVLFTVLSNGYRFGARLNLAAQQEEMHRLRVEIAERVLAPEGVRTTQSPGEMLSLATSDADQTGYGLGLPARLLVAFTGVTVTAVLLLRIDLRLGLAVIGGCLLVLVLLRLVTPRIAGHVDVQQQTVARAAGIATDFMQGLRPLKGIGGEAQAILRYRGASRAAMHASVRSARTYGEISGATMILSGLFLAAVAFFAGRLALSGQITVGELVSVVGLAQFLAEPMSGLGELSAQYGSLMACASRIATFLGGDPLVRGGDGEIPANRPVALSVDPVRYATLTGLTLDVAPGELVAVASTDPAHADDLALILAAEAQLEDLAGTSHPVRLGGVALSDARLDDVRRQLVVAPHHADVLDGTLRSNIGADHLSQAQRDQLLRACAVDEVTTLFAEGLDHPTAARGENLSGGQRQRLALARALAADPQILVLHDPTTAVDAVTEQRIAAGIRDVRHNGGPLRSTVLITTAPALLGVADRVLLVHQGRVQAQGAHRDLLSDPDYREAVLR